MDFAVGSVLFAAVAACTLGTLGSDLGFSDNMLVAGQRAQAMAALAGGAFALGNICFLAAIALIGQANASLLTFGVFGAGLALLRLQTGPTLKFAAACVFLLLASALAFSSARGKRQSPAKVIKGGIVGFLAGLAFLAVFPLITLAQPDQLGIGAYGGILIAAVGILVATFSLNFFFLNISLEGAQLGYGTYFGAKSKDHVIGTIGGAVWTAGALALYTAYTGAAKLTPFQAWLAPFAGAVLAVLTGLLIWQKMPQPPAAKQKTITATILFVIGVVLLIVKV